MKFRQQHTLKAEGLNLTPLVDVVFQLIIFFMLTSPFVMQPGVKIELPEIANAQEVESSPHEVRIDAHDATFFAGREVTKEELLFELGRIRDDDAGVVIRGDAKATLGAVLEVWDACVSANIRRINIYTRKQTRR